MALEKRQYQMISVYKFILCILVVFLHNKTADYFSLTEGQYRIYNFVTYYIPQLAVPIMSGYLMFRGYKKETAWNKITRRLAKLIPAYLFWNVVAIPYSVLVTQFSNIFDILSGGDILTYKFNFPLWYVFDLLIFVIISPIFYTLLKNRNTGVFIILLAYALYSMRIGLPDIMFRDDVHLYYMLGAYAGMHCSSIKSKKISLIIPFVSGAVGLIFSVILWESWLRVVMLSLYSIGMTIGWIWMADKRCFPDKLCNIAVANTFIYYTHFFFIGGIKKAIGILFRKCLLDGLFWCFIAFFISTIICVIAILFLRKMLLLAIEKIENQKVKQIASLLIP